MHEARAPAAGRQTARAAIHADTWRAPRTGRLAGAAHRIHGPPRRLGSMHSIA